MTPPIWRKSSRSVQGTSGQCVEVARLPGAIGIRDGKRPHAGHLSISHQEFATLLHQIKYNNLIRRS